MKNERRDKILALKEQGLTYREIMKLAGVSMGTVAYYCGEGQKEKAIKRANKHSNKHPYIKKINSFHEKSRNKNRNFSNKIKQCKHILNEKLSSFLMKRDNNTVIAKIALDDVIKKFGENPKCYLTGDDIDISKSRSYHFDHIVPRAKGGDNTLDNLGFSPNFL
jgi:transposase